MDNKQPSENDENLCRVLKEWQTEESLPAGFQDQVWKRIEGLQGVQTRSPSIWKALAHWTTTRFPRPAFASAYVGVLLAVGVTAGLVGGRQEAARTKDELAIRYVRMLDPYLAPR